MKIHLSLLFLTFVLFSPWKVDARNLLPTNAPARLDLRDQYDIPQHLLFPATNVTLLTIADKAGSGQIAAWVIPIKQRFGRSIDVRGIADVSAVPAPMRGLVRREFRKSQQYPVMMDWSGEACRAFSYSGREALILILDFQGHIIHRVRGPANDRSLENLIYDVNRLVSTRPSPGR